jgi:ABC-type uncharacterized transport system substrate-binding protein
MRNPAIFALCVILTTCWFPSKGLAQLQRPVRIGALTQSWGPTPSLIGLREGLRELGYREPEDFVIGLRFTQGDATALPSAARELVSQGVNLLIADTSEAARSAASATPLIPILFIGGVDPVIEGLVQSYARPGGNLTGVTSRDIELIAKRLEVFRDSVPGLRRVLFVYDVASPRVEIEVGAYRDAARQLGLALLERPVRSRDEARKTFDQIRRGEAQGIVMPFSMNLNIPGLALDSSPRLAIPVMCPDRFFVERGGFASYGADLHAGGRQAARLVDKILRGATPGEIPVERNERIEFALNLKTSRALGISVPREMLIRADRVFE